MISAAHLADVPPPRFPGISRKPNARQTDIDCDFVVGKVTLKRNVGSEFEMTVLKNHLTEVGVEGGIEVV